MDLLDPTSIDTFADRFQATGQPLHILVNSAGIMACPLTRDARGYEAQFATNHLGHFQLSVRLWDALVPTRYNFKLDRLGRSSGRRPRGKKTFDPMHW